MLGCLRRIVDADLAERRANGSPKLRLIRKPIVSIAAPTFIRIRVSPATAAINSDRAIAEKLTAAW